MEFYLYGLNLSVYGRIIRTNILVNVSVKSSLEVSDLATELLFVFQKPIDATVDQCWALNAMRYASDGPRLKFYKEESYNPLLTPSCLRLVRGERSASSSGPWMCSLVTDLYR